MTRAKAQLRIHDFSRGNQQHTIDTLRDALHAAKELKSDGTIVILTDRSGRPTILVGGKMVRGEAALMHLARLSASIIIDHKK